MTSDQSNAANKGSRKLTRKPVILAAAANRHQCIRADARQYGAIRGRQDCHPTDHRPPYGRAPLIFADIVQKVTPAWLASTSRVTPRGRVGHGA
jgi:hypothetical protein